MWCLLKQRCPHTAQKKRGNLLAGQALWRCGGFRGWEGRRKGPVNRNVHPDPSAGFLAWVPRSLDVTGKPTRFSLMVTCDRDTAASLSMGIRPETEKALGTAKGQQGHGEERRECKAEARASDSQLVWWVGEEREPPSLGRLGLACCACLTYSLKVLNGKFQKLKNL